MILFNFALPGGFGRWCDGLLEELVRAAGHEVAVETWPSHPEMLGFQPLPSVLDAIALRLIAGARVHLAMGVRQPDEGLLATLSAAQSRFVVALDDPRFTVAELLGETGAELGAVTRAVANSCPLLMHFAALPGALIVRAEDARADIGATVAAVARHFGLGLADDRLAQIARAMSAAGPPGAGGKRASIPPSGQTVIDGALAAYAEQFAGARLGQIVWRRELFIHYAEGFARPNGIIDLAGPPRPLIYGPYIHLLPGRWTARVVLGFSSEAAGSTFLIDVYANPNPLALGQVVLVPDHGGVFSADIDFAVERPTTRGLEIRIQLASANARGQMAFGHVVLQPLAMRMPDAVAPAAPVQEFEAVLDL